MPNAIAYKSDKRVWWKCRVCHNEWIASVSNRDKGTGCPFCSGRRCIKGINDLATTNPDLVDEWDYEKNGDMTPENVSAGSSRKAWWICKYGHKYRTMINLRGLHGTGCPECAKGLKTSFPEQAVYYYICMVYPDAINSYMEYGKELDIFIPNLNTAIEYDGWIWHNKKNSIKNDLIKNDLCRDKGVRLIRIREEGAIELPKDDNLTILNCKPNDIESLTNAIKALFALLKANCDIDVERDRNLILERYLVAYHNNSLSIKYPQLVKEWNQKKNGKVTPDMVNGQTTRKYWWICDRGHEWKASPNQRAGRPDFRNGKGSGCPYCSGHRVIKGETDLATINPQLAAEWNYEKNGKLTPSELKPFSGRKVWWHGKCGHEWQAPPRDRMAGNGCPYCSGQKALKGFNDLESNYPELTKEWDYEKNGIDPSEVNKNADKKYWWKCEKGHEWFVEVYNRVKGSGCPYCGHKIVNPGETDLATVRPDLAVEWNYEKNKNKSPADFLPSSGKMVWWKGKCGHEWKATINNRARGNGCPYCRGTYTLIGENDLKTEYPEIAKYWDYQKNDSIPDQFTSSSGKYVWWICEKGHSWNNRIQLQVRAKGCPYCLNKKLLQGFNDLLTTRPDIAEEWHPTLNGDLTPNMVIASNDKKVWWKGKCGHEWEASIMARTKSHNPTGCPYCTGKKALKGFNDLGTKFPELAEEWDYEKNDLLPSEVTCGSAKRVYWICKQGHSWAAEIYTRTAPNKERRTCPYCKNTQNRCKEEGIEKDRNVTVEEEHS